MIRILYSCEQQQKRRIFSFEAEEDGEYVDTESRVLFENGISLGLLDRICFCVIIRFEERRIMRDGNYASRSDLIAFVLHFTIYLNDPAKMVYRSTTLLVSATRRLWQPLSFYLNPRSVLLPLGRRNSGQSGNKTS